MSVLSTDVFGLGGRKALVTGASSGIGSAVALALAEAGAHVAIHYRNGAAAAEELAAGIAERGGRCITVQADLSEDAEAERLVREAAEGLGGLDILVNNAGAMGERSPFAEAEGALAGAVFDLNCRSIVAVSRAAFPHLRSSGAGAIVNTGSIAGRTGGGPGAGLYGAAKGYVHTLTRGMAKEFAPHGIRVNAVAPGVIDTPFHRETPPAVLESMRAAIPLGRLGTAEECAGAYLFLCSSRLGGYVTGQIIDVNGGQFMP